MAWQALTEMAPAETPRGTVEAADRELLLRVWKQASKRPWYAEQALLTMATAAGSPALIEQIVPSLESDLPRTRELAVAALAAITGWDARLDSQGLPRALPEVVDEYRRECAPR
jgi:hypothetical protein